MITEFKIFEGFKYLSSIDEGKFSEYITPIINDYFDKKIPKLIINDFDKSNFNYRNVINDYIFDKIFFNIIYRYGRDNFNASVPEMHNSFQRILDGIKNDSILGGYKTNIFMRIENRLVDIFEKDYKLYKRIYKNYNGELTSTLKDKLRYIIDSEKYNL